MRGGTLKFFFVISFVCLSFSYPQGGAASREDAVYGMLGEVIEYVIPKELYGKDESFTIEEVDAKFLRDVTNAQDFQKNKRYRFLTLAVGETRVVIDKIDTSGGKKGFLILHVVVRQAPEAGKGEKKNNVPQVEEPKTLKQEKINPEGNSKNPLPKVSPPSPTNEKNKPLDKQPVLDKTVKSSNPVFNHLMEGYKNKKYRVERESFIKGLDDYIKDGGGSPKEIMQLKFIKAQVLEDLSHKSEANTILKELADAEILPEDIKDDEVKSLRRQVFYDLYRNRMDENKEEEAKGYLEKALSVTDEASPYYYYFLYKIGNLNKKEKDYDAAYSQLKYVYQLMTGMEDVKVASGDNENLGEIYMFKGKRFEDLKPEEKEEVLALFHGDKEFMDKVFFDLAEVYEASKKNRDYNKAMKLYEDLLKNFPESDLAKLAKLKIFYLNNNFIKPR